MADAPALGAGGRRSWEFDPPLWYHLIRLREAEGAHVEPIDGTLRHFAKSSGWDPEADCQRIMHLSFGDQFPWDTVRALEIALYRTYCVPSISALLDRSGEFYRAAQRRYDDTAILVAEMCEWGYEEGAGAKRSSG